MLETDIRSCQIINIVESILRFLSVTVNSINVKTLSESHFLDYDIEQMMVHEKYCSLQYDEDRCRLKECLKIFKGSS